MGRHQSHPFSVRNRLAVIGLSRLVEASGAQAVVQPPSACRLRRLWRSLVVPSVLRSRGVSFIAKKPSSGHARGVRRVGHRVRAGHHSRSRIRIIGPTRQSPRGKVARAKRRHEKAKAKEEAKKAAEKELADAGRVARATKRAVTGAD